MLENTKLTSKSQKLMMMMRSSLFLLSILLLPFCSDAEYCNGIEPGDIMVTGFNTQNPDEVVLVVLDDIDQGATFYMTDRTWDDDASDFVDQENDGTLKWVFGRAARASQEICHACRRSGRVLDFFEPVEDDNSNSTFRLSRAGDSIIIYCMTEPADDNSSSILPISAITNMGNWTSDDIIVDDSSVGGDEVVNATNATNATNTTNTTTPTDDGSASSYSTSRGSSLPSSLPADTVTTLDFFPNYEYDGNTVGTAAQVRMELSDAAKWDGHVDFIENLPLQSSFKIVMEKMEDDDNDTSGSPTRACTLLLLLLLGPFALAVA